MKTCGLVFLALNLAALGCASRPKPSPAATEPVVAESTVPYDVSSQPPPVLKSLAGTRWTVVEIDGAPAASDTDGWAPQSLEFDAPGSSVTGHGGVNRFAGRYSADRKAITFGPLAMTRRAGPPERMEAEQRYTAALSRVVAWRQDGINLVLNGSGGERLLLLMPAAK